MTSDTALLEVEVPVHTTARTNARTCWQARARRTKRERLATWAVLSGRPAPAPPLVVTLTRLSARRLDDDNLRGALKAVRDEVARWLRVDDAREELVAYRYGQATGRPSRVHVRVERRGAA